MHIRHKTPRRKAKMHMCVSLIFLQAFEPRSQCMCADQSAKNCFLINCMCVREVAPLCVWNKKEKESCRRSSKPDTIIGERCFWALACSSFTRALSRKCIIFSGSIRPVKGCFLGSPLSPHCHWECNFRRNNTLYERVNLKLDATNNSALFSLWPREAPFSFVTNFGRWQWELSKVSAIKSTLIRFWFANTQSAHCNLHEFESHILVTRYFITAYFTTEDFLFISFHEGFW